MFEYCPHYKCVYAKLNEKKSYCSDRSSPCAANKPLDPCPHVKCAISTRTKKTDFCSYLEDLCDKPKEEKNCAHVPLIFKCAYAFSHNWELVCGYGFLDPEYVPGLPREKYLKKPLVKDLPRCLKEIIPPPPVSRKVLEDEELEIFLHVIERKNRHKTAILDNIPF